LQELKQLLTCLEVKPNIIAITEVKYKTDITFGVNELNLDGFKTFCNDFAKNSRGILFYVAEELESEIVELDSQFSEVLLLQTKCKSGCPLLVGCIYRSPSSTDDNDISLCHLLNQICARPNNELVIMGDFNFRDIDWDRWESASNNKGENLFLSNLRDNFLLQHVHTPTRARGSQTPHILDLVITKDEILDNIEYLAPLGKSDHAILKISCNLKWQERDNTDRYNFNRGDYNKIRECLDIDWDELFISCDGDVDEMWSLFRSKVESVMYLVPKVASFSSWKKNKWYRPISKTIRDYIKTKNKLWKDYIATKDPVTFARYRHISNLVRNETRSLYRQEQNDIAELSRKNPKKFWNYINSRGKSKSQVADLTCHDQAGNEAKADTDEKKAEVLADFFSSVFSVEPLGEFEKLQERSLETPMVEPVKFSYLDICSRLGKLNVNKSSGPDGLHPRLLYETRNEIAYPLKLIFDCSFKTKRLPLEWRSANISAIFKKGKKSEVGNYRPVSLTCIVSKVMESIVRDSIMEHFVKNNLFTCKQFGFIKGRSTVLQLLKVLDNWTKSLEMGGHIDVIYTDLEKAFDKVPHRRLISKLNSYGINSDVIAWIEAFLGNRRQRVKINNVCSEWASVLSGIPQGSILGPLLFIIYINDLVDSCSNGSELYLYADDAKLFRHILNDLDKALLQEDLDNLSTWTDKWLLKLNVNKCKYMLYEQSHIDASEHQYMIAGINLEHVEAMKDLGVKFDSKLKFSDHINEKINKAYGTLGLIKRNFKFLSEECFVTLYKTMVRSHLEYAQGVWSPHLVGHIKHIEKVQMRATKLIARIKDLSYSERLKELKLPTLKYRRFRGDMIELYKMITGIYNKDVSLDLEYATSNLRGNRYKLFQGQLHSNLRKFSFSNRVIHLWNGLPDAVVAVDNLNCFKHALDKFWSHQEVKFDWKSEILGFGSRIS